MIYSLLKDISSQNIALQSSSLNYTNHVQNTASW